VVCATVSAQPYSSPPEDSTSAPPISLDDGPHVFWQDDSTAVVMYYCDSAMSSRVHYVADTLRFRGTCGDTAIEYIVAASAPAPAPYEFDGASRVMCISDIHGDVAHFSEILVNAGVMDGRGHWTWGTGHLVINGDVFDRGDRVTECLWLIYRLEREATSAGGAVHYLLGNHELMVIRGDLRYVHERYPLGIAHRRRVRYDELFGPDMELGRWLRSKHTVIRIDDLLFVHGGLSPEVMDGGLDAGAINRRVLRGLDASAARLLHDDTLQLLYGSYGPLWYRGLLHPLEGRYPAATAEEIDRVLVAFGAEQIVVGHSQQDSITVFHNGKVVGVDVRVDELGSQQAALWEDGTLYRVTGSGARHPIPDLARE